MGLRLPIFAYAAALLMHSAAAARPPVIGTKRFTESYVLGEIARGVLREHGLTPEIRQGMGGTIILWQALRSGAITAYPDYTGTIAEEILRLPGDAPAELLRRKLATLGIGLSQSLGFDNSYALAMRSSEAERLGVRRLADLRAHPDLRLGLSPEFLRRRDGWGPLSQRYGLQMRDVRGVEHAIGYEALARGRIDVIDIYTTDAKILELGLVALDDNLHFFPSYQGVWLYRMDTPPAVVAALRTMEGTIGRGLMVQMNAEAERRKNYAVAAALYFRGDARQRALEHTESLPARLLRWTAQHLFLVGISLLLAVLVGLPLGVLASRPGLLSEAVLGATGVLQTIPSLALLSLLVSLSFLGISPWTAITALFLYSLLPIVRSTAAGIQSIPVSLRESAAALGLSDRSQLFKVLLPMASRSIMSGIQTSAVIDVGTATLAAFVGAGGLGEPIISGLNLNDRNTILEGAIPAALLALLIQLFFRLLQRWLIPKGLQLASSTNAR